MRIKEFFLSSLKFILPFILWLFLFKTFLLREATIFSENFSQYSIVKFYLDNLRLGVYPLWNPFILWGVPDTITLVNIGPFNPLWLLTLFLDTIGLDFYGAYLTTIIVYFFIGQIGFYLLAKTLLRDKVTAYAAFIMLTFSSISMSMFAQYIMMLLWVPSVWFFYFFISFLQTWQKRFFIGTIFSLMLILSTYLPFYFLTVFLIVILLFLFFYGRDFKGMVIGAGGFLRKNILLFAICLGAIGLSLFPTLQAYRATVEQEIVVPFRQIEKNAVLHQGVTLAKYAKTTDGAISARMFFDDLFSNLDQIEYGNDGFVYVSLFAYLVLGLSIFNRLTKRAALLFLLSLILFLISMTSATPVHPFLFKHVFFFKLFRNLHYLMPFLLSAFVLFVAEQLKLLMESKSTEQRLRWFWMGFALAVHAGAWVFLVTKENVIISSYLTIACSFLFFFCLFAGWIKNNGACIYFCLLAVIVLQPAQVLFGYNSQASYYASEIISQAIQVPPVTGKFSFLRPDFNQEQANMKLSTDPQNYFNSYRISMADSPGFFMPYEYGFPTFWSYYFSKNIPEEVVRQYSRYKILVYDEVKIIEKGQENLRGIADALRKDVHTAFVSSQPGGEEGQELSSLITKPDQGPDRRVMIISQPIPELSIKDFNVNSLIIETQFNTEKFLVYNDSFDRHWQAWINGEMTKIYRANLAFKGIKLPAGRNEVCLRYVPWGGIALYFFIFFVFAGMLIALVWQLSRGL